MRYKAGQKEEARARLVAAAGRGFRQAGYGGIGVDGLAKEAEVTSGAFYGHFKSKELAFNEALAVGIDQLRDSVLALQARHGAAWVEAFVIRYMGERRTCDLRDSCALQSLAPEVARAPDGTKSVFRDHLLPVAEAVAKGLPAGTPQERLDRAWAILALLSGAVTLARALGDPALGAGVAEGVTKAALVVAGLTQEA